MAAAQMAASSEILYRIFEFAPDAILLVDGRGCVARANAQTERMFGYSRDELLGQPVELLIPDRFAARHVAYRDGYLASPHARPMGVGLDLFGKRLDGSEFPLDIMLSPLETGADPLFLAVVRDVTERKRIEAETQAARETYVRELHHRVKNNLQIISSLLFLQSTHTHDARMLDLLRESQGRIKSIALIHERLYRSADLSRIDFAEYLRDLASVVFRTYGVGQESVALRTDVDDVSMDIDTAIPCGLIINELVSNALKHAFLPGQTGEVCVRLAAAGSGGFTLEVSDDGAGLPPGFDWRTGGTLGLRLVADLTRQLDGVMEVPSGPGARFRLTFREIHYPPRN